ncbi:MAG TPA: glycosyltransferase family 87 protein [Chthoniobacteraceae bacterium]|jgi:hypothetical protein|nr:glycosyltransferase family 87 protein [Chthoniobacteraceae bacterium]
MSEDTKPQRLWLKVAATLWAGIGIAMLVHAIVKPHSSTLYTVFRSGGARWLLSENLYPKVDEYIYSPFAAAFFAPFALLPDRVAGALWRLTAMGVFCAGFAVWVRYARGAAERAGLAWLLLLPLSVGNFFNGQANPLVIGLLMLAVIACRRERWMLGALCVGLATYFKIYPLAVGLLLCVVHPRKFPWRLALALAGMFALSLVLQRPAYVLEQYRNWLHTLGQDPRRTKGYFGTYRDIWLLLRILRVPITLRGWSLLQAASGAALAGWLWLARRRGMAAGHLDFLLLALGTCWMLLFGPATESATYVIIAPPLALACVRWPGTRSLTGAICAYVLLVASQMLSSWGHQHQTPYTHLIQPIATMIFAATLLRSRE